MSQDGGENQVQAGDVLKIIKGNFVGMLTQKDAICIMIQAPKRRSVRIALMDTMNIMAYVIINAMYSK